MSPIGIIYHGYNIASDLFEDSIDEQIDELSRDIQNGKYNGEELGEKQAELQELQAQQKQELDTWRTYANGYAQIYDKNNDKSADFFDLAEKKQDFLSSFFNNMTPEFMEQNELTSQSTVANFVSQWIDALGNENGEISKAFNKLLDFDIDTKDMTPEEIKIAIDNLIAKLLQAMKASGIDVDDSSTGIAQFKATWGIEFVDENADDYNKQLLHFYSKDSLDSLYTNNRPGFNLPQESKLNSKEDIGLWASTNKVTTEELDALAKKGYNATTSINELTNALKKNREVQQKNSLKSFSKAWENLGKGDDDAAKAAGEAKEKLLELAEAGKLTVKTFEKSDIAESFLKETGLSAEEATAKINKLIENTKQLSAMRAGITSITSAYDEKKEHKSVSSSTLGSMYDTLGVEEWGASNKKAWENYKSIASSSKSSLKQLKAAQDSLATSYVNSNNFLANITDSSYDYYVSLLREMGVTNAQAVATEVLNRKKMETMLASEDFQKATDSDINALFLYSKQLSGTKSDIVSFILQTALANKTTLQTDGSINNLISLISKVDETSKAIKILQRLMANTDALEKLNQENPGFVDARTALEKTRLQKKIDADNKRIKDLSKKGKTKPKPILNLTKGDKTGDKSQDSSKSKPTKTIQTIDWIARKLTTLNTRLETVKKNFDAIFTRKKVNTTADLIKQQNKNLDDQIQLQKQLEKANNKAAKKYDKLAGKIGLDKKYRNLVNNGGYSIEDFVTTSSSSSKKSKGKGKKKVSQSTYDKIQKYIDYRDKASSARQGAIQAKVEQENARIQKLQNEQSRYDTLASEASSRQEYGSPNKRKEAAKDEWTWQKKSYDVQIKQAKLQKDSAKVKQLQAEMSNAETANKVKQLEIDKDVYDTRLATYQAQQATAKLKDANSYVNNQIKDTKESYKLQIKIAKAQGNTALASQLEAEAQKANVDLLQQKVDNAKAYYNAELGLLDNKGQ